MPRDGEFRDHSEACDGGYCADHFRKHNRIQPNNSSLPPAVRRNRSRLAQLTPEHLPLYAKAAHGIACLEPLRPRRLQSRASKQFKQCRVGYTRTQNSAPFVTVGRPSDRPPQTYANQHLRNFENPQFSLHHSCTIRAPFFGTIPLAPISPRKQDIAQPTHIPPDFPCGDNVEQQGKSEIDAFMNSFARAIGPVASKNQDERPGRASIQETPLAFLRTNEARR
jgi:hypothetical protein